MSNLTFHGIPPNTSRRLSETKDDHPKQINCKVESTDAAIKGQTVSSSYKPAKLENGVKIQVPPFIESGDNVVIDTRTIEYVKKV